MSINMYIASCAWILLVFGVLKRRDRRVHVCCVLMAICLDIALVLYLQFTRDAIQTAVGFTLGFWQQAHIAVSSLALVLYFPVLWFGAVLLLGKGAEKVRSLHLCCAWPAFALRTVGFVLMFSMLKTSVV